MIDMDDTQKQQEVATRDMLVDLALSAAGRLAGREELLEAPPAVRDRVVVTATVGYLVGLGLIPQPDPQQLAWAPKEIPEHLRPDIWGAIAANRQVRDLLFKLAG